MIAKGEKSVHSSGYILLDARGNMQGKHHTRGVKAGDHVPLGPLSGSEQKVVYGVNFTQNPQCPSDMGYAPKDPVESLPYGPGAQGDTVIQDPGNTTNIDTDQSQDVETNALPSRLSMQGGSQSKVPHPHIEHRGQN